MGRCWGLLVKKWMARAGYIAEIWKTSADGGEREG